MHIMLYLSYAYSTLLASGMHTVPQLTQEFSYNTHTTFALQVCILASSMDTTMHRLATLASISIMVAG